MRHYHFYYFLKNENNARLKYADIKQDIDTMYEASNILTKMRKFVKNLNLVIKFLDMDCKQLNCNDLEEFIDEDDRVFYEVTLTARKDSKAYLTTGNLKRYPKKTFVVEPKQMCQIIDENLK